MDILLSINPIAFEIGIFTVRWYGIFITSAIVMGYLVAFLCAKKRKIKMDYMLELFMWVVPFAIIFARLFYVAFHISDFFPLQNLAGLIDIFAIWKGGISILGAIPGGALGAYIASRKNKISFCETLDIAAPGVVLGQALGRWGNWANQELYGRAVIDSNLQFFPYAVYIDYEQGWFQATFFYEMILNLIGFAIIILVFNKSKKNLVTFMTYLTWYMIVRAVMEIFRVDAVSVGGIKIGVLGCSLVAGISLILLVMIMVRKIHTGKPMNLLNNITLEN